jgi:hypothetical protein
MPVKRECWEREGIGKFHGVKRDVERSYEGERVRNG